MGTSLATKGNSCVMEFFDPIAHHLVPFSDSNRQIELNIQSPLSLSNQNIHSYVRSDIFPSSGEGVGFGSECFNNGSGDANHRSEGFQSPQNIIIPTPQAQKIRSEHFPYFPNSRSVQNVTHPELNTTFNSRSLLPNGDVVHLSFADTIRGRDASNALCLSAPTMKGNLPAIHIGKQVYKRGLDFCKFALVGRMDLNKVKPARVREAAVGLWKINGTCKITPLGKGFFMIRLDNASDYDKVIAASTWYLDGSPMKIQKWTPGFDPASVCQSTANVWIRFPGLRQQFWDNEILLSMANAIGIPLTVDPHTKERTFGFFAAVLVEVDMAKNLPNKIVVDVEDEGNFFQDVEYYRLPKYCSYCRIVGHSPGECRRIRATADGTYCGTCNSTTHTQANCDKAMTGKQKMAKSKRGQRRNKKKEKQQQGQLSDGEESLSEPENNNLSEIEHQNAVEQQVSAPAAVIKPLEAEIEEELTGKRAIAAEAEQAEPVSYSADLIAKGIGSQHVAPAPGRCNEFQSHDANGGAGFAVLTGGTMVAPEIADTALGDNGGQSATSGATTIYEAPAPVTVKQTSAVSFAADDGSGFASLALTHSSFVDDVGASNNGGPPLGCSPILPTIVGLGGAEPCYQSDGSGRLGSRALTVPNTAPHSFQPATANGSGGGGLISDDVATGYPEAAETNGGFIEGMGAEGGVINKWGNDNNWLADSILVHKEALFIGKCSSTQRVGVLVPPAGTSANFLNEVDNLTKEDGALLQVQKGKEQLAFVNKGGEVNSSRGKSVEPGDFYPMIHAGSGNATGSKSEYGAYSPRSRDNLYNYSSPSGSGGGHAASAPATLNLKHYSVNHSPVIYGDFNYATAAATVDGSKEAAFRHPVQAGSSVGGGRGWKVNPKLYRDKKKKASSMRLDKELREISIFNRWDDLAEMDESEVSDFSDFSEDVDPIANSIKKPKGSNVITRQQARLQDSAKLGT